MKWKTLIASVTLSTLFLTACGTNAITQMELLREIRTRMDLKT